MKECQFRTSFAPHACMYTDITGLPEQHTPGYITVVGPTFIDVDFSPCRTRPPQDRLKTKYRHTVDRETFIGDDFVDPAPTNPLIDKSATGDINRRGGDSGTIFLHFLRLFSNIKKLVIFYRFFPFIYHF